MGAQEKWNTDQARRYFSEQDKRPQRAHKFGARKTVVDGILFDSKHEGKIYQELKALERAGEIEDLRLQVTYPLEVNTFLVCQFRADFTFREAGELVVVDAKGYQTPDSILKHNLMLAIYGIHVELR